MQTNVEFTHLLTAFTENKQFEAPDGKVDSTSNHWDKSKSNEVSVTFTLSSAAAKVLSHHNLISSLKAFVSESIEAI